MGKQAKGRKVNAEEVAEAVSRYVRVMRLGQVALEKSDRAHRRGNHRLGKILGDRAYRLARLSGHLQSRLAGILGVDSEAICANPRWLKRAEARWAKEDAAKVAEVSHGA